MSSPQRFRKKRDEVQAMQWTGTSECADALWEWTQYVIARNPNGSPHMVATDFMVLGEGDAYEVFSCYDEDYELIEGNEVECRIAEGYTAVIRDRLHGTWVNVRTGDWIIRTADGHSPCSPDEFANIYEAVPDGR